MGSTKNKLALPGVCSRVVGIASYIAFVAWGCPVLAVDTVQNFHDRSHDAVARPTDRGADDPFDPQTHRLIDLKKIKTGMWAPDAPESDLFSGEYDVTGEFVRIDLVFRGLVNPPGSVAPSAFDPFAYGDNPVYGFVEIDMDDDVWTGGELNAPQFRYLGNVARFGGQALREDFFDRMALDASAFDGDILTPPFVDRHGEEFHLAFLGGEVGRADIDEVEGDGGPTFDEGETWRLKGRFFHRAHGFERFSLAKGGRFPGEYAPECVLQFRHNVVDDVTRVTLVFPLTNTGAGLMIGQPPESLNHDPSDQASVLEALNDLQLSAMFLRTFPTGLPEEDIIRDWAEQDPSEYLDPTTWAITALFGISYTKPDPSGLHFVWTDVFPDVVRGDVDGNGEREEEDENLIAQFISAKDLADGVSDGRVVIAGFAEDFSVYDLNYDGVVDQVDLLIVEAEGDGDDDDDVDLADCAIFQQCFSQSALSSPQCAGMQLDGDDSIGLDDFRLFLDMLTGPESD